MVRTVYNVSPDNGQWKVTQNGVVLSRHTTKDVAVADAKQAAKENSPSQVRIQRTDGTWQDEVTYGNDPYPPKG